MTTLPYTLQQFVADFRSIAGGTPEDPRVARAVGPLAQRLAREGGLLAMRKLEFDPQQGFSFHVLHEEPDHTLSVALLSWQPGRGTPPHNHGTWGVVVGVEGDEKNTFYRRADDGSTPGHAELEVLSEKTFGVGEAILLSRETIHSVVNETGHISTSLHVYGKNVNYTGRSQFDLAARREIPWLVKQT